MGISIDYDVINIINIPDQQDPDQQHPDQQDPDQQHPDQQHPDQNTIFDDQNTISYDQFIRFLCIMSAIYPTQLK